MSKDTCVRCNGTGKNSGGRRCGRCGGDGHAHTEIERRRARLDEWMTRATDADALCDVLGAERDRLRAENNELREALKPFVFEDGCERTIPSCARGEKKCRWCKAAALMSVALGGSQAKGSEPTRDEERAG